MVCGGGFVGGGGWIMVDRACWRASLGFRFSVSVDLGRFLRTSLDVRPGQVMKKPASIALHQLSMTVLNQAQ